MTEPTLADWITARHADKIPIVVVLDHQEPGCPSTATAIDQELSVLPDTCWAWKTDYRLKRFREHHHTLDHQRSRNVSARGVSFPARSIVICHEFFVSNFIEGISLLSFHCLLDDGMVVFVFRVTDDTLRYAQTQCANFPIFHLRRRIEGPVDGNGPAVAGGATTKPCLVEPGLPADDV